MTIKNSRASLLCPLMIAVAFFFTGCVSGSSDGGGGNYWAVIVGVSDYQVSSFNLNYADDDAADFFQIVTSYDNWDSGRITYLLNSSATKEAIRQAISSTAGRMAADDYFVFFFSGHGTFGPDYDPADESDGTDEFLVPHDALSSSYDNDIRDDELEDWLNGIPSSSVAVILDASFSGGMFKGKEGVKAITRSWHQGEGTLKSSNGMTRDVSRSGYIILTASDDDESPIETSVLGNGVFTYYLVEGLAGPANNDGNGFISVEESYSYADPRASAFYSGMHPQMQDLHGGEYELVLF